MLCRDCDVEKSPDLFYDSTNHTSGKMSWCIECNRRQNAKYYRDTKQSKIKDDRLRRYGLTNEQFEELLAKQDNKCALCDVILGMGRDSYSLTIDHDHSCCNPKRTWNTCGKCVRGILCRSCNVKLGHYEKLRNNPRVQEYLSQFVTES